MWCPLNAMFPCPRVHEVILKVSPLSDSILSEVPSCQKMCFSRPEMVSWAVAMFYRVCCQPVVTSTMVCSSCLGVFMAVVLFARPHHTGNPAAALSSRGSLLQWLGWLQHGLLIQEWSVLWPLWSGPPVDEPICLLQLMFHGPIRLWIAHPSTPSPSVPKLIQFWQPYLPVHCFDVLQWCGFWAHEHLPDVPFQSCFWPVH